jgi:hypothetical protein
MLADDEGWVLVSSYHIKNGLRTSGKFRNELYQVAVDGSKRVRRLAHLHSELREYWDSPRATISRDGRWAVFTSNWGRADRKDVFIVRIPPPGSGGGSGNDTVPPSISSVSATGVSSNGATITWTTNERSDKQVEYGTTASYGTVTPYNTAMATSHSASLSGLAASTLYHYRVRSKDASGNLAVSGDFTFTTAANGGEGGGDGARSSVKWTQVINAVANGGSLRKTAGHGDTADSGGRSEQAITSGGGYMEFTAASANKTFFCGLARNATGTDYQGIDYSIKITDTGVAEVRENNAYRAETRYVAGDVFRIAVEGSAVKYYKNGSVFYTSAKALSYPLVVKASLISIGAQVGNAFIAAFSGGAEATVYKVEGPRQARVSLVAVIAYDRFALPKRRFRLLS